MRGETLIKSLSESSETEERKIGKSVAKLRWNIGENSPTKAGRNQSATETRTRGQVRVKLTWVEGRLGTGYPKPKRGMPPSSTLLCAVQNVVTYKLRFQDVVGCENPGHVAR